MALSALSLHVDSQAAAEGCQQVGAELRCPGQAAARAARHPSDIPAWAEITSMVCSGARHQGLQHREVSPQYGVEEKRRSKRVPAAAGQGSGHLSQPP